jgi:diguanylate cyclase (GGDEF)-like protein
MDIACRFGGEEFVVIMPSSPFDIAYKRAELIRNSLENLTVGHRGQQIRTTISAGVALYPDHGMTGDDVLRAADLALYQAKGQGRNRVIAFKK